MRPLEGSWPTGWGPLGTACSIPKVASCHTTVVFWSYHYHSLPERPPASCIKILFPNQHPLHIFLIKYSLVPPLSLPKKQRAFPPAPLMEPDYRHQCLHLLFPSLFKQIGTRLQGWASQGKIDSLCVRQSVGTHYPWAVWSVTPTSKKFSEIEFVASLWGFSPTAQCKRHVLKLASQNLRGSGGQQRLSG